MYDNDWFCILIKILILGIIAFFLGWFGVIIFAILNFIYSPYLDWFINKTFNRKT
jgi:hypothetical protein